VRTELARVTLTFADSPRGLTKRIASRIRRWPTFSIIVLTLILIAGTTSQWIAPYPIRYGDLTDRHEPPAILGEDSEYLLGTDNLGRDIFSRILAGARVSLLVAGVTIALAAAAGTVSGLISGWAGGWVDEVVMRAVDGILAMPLILVVLVLAVVIGPSLQLLIAILAVGQWPQFARVVRGETLVLKEMDYVKLAIIAGASSPRVWFKHLLPGVFNSVIVVATLNVPAVILTEAGLSFLGVGVPPPTPSWGGMVSDGRAYIVTAWWVSFFPGLAIALTVIALVFLGDWLRDRLDPRLRQI
jgi:peptide/nickel transport system permease protein